MQLVERVAVVAHCAVELDDAPRPGLPGAAQGIALPLLDPVVHRRDQEHGFDPGERLGQ
jgi:hypothetical protein